MIRKVIDFEAAKDRHVRQEIDADQAQGELRARLITVMVLSGLSDTSLTSVGIDARHTEMAEHDRLLGGRDTIDQLMGLRRMTAVGRGGIEFYAGHCTPH